jgi:hypothetical protein
MLGKGKLNEGLMKYLKEKKAKKEKMRPAIPKRKAPRK